MRSASRSDRACIGHAVRVLLLLEVEGPPEEHDVRLRLVDGVVDPPARLLHAERSPLDLRVSFFLKSASASRGWKRHSRRRGVRTNERGRIASTRSNSCSPPEEVFAWAAPSLCPEEERRDGTHTYRRSTSRSIGSCSEDARAGCEHEETRRTCASHRHRRSFPRPLTGMWAWCPLFPPFCARSKPNPALLCVPPHRFQPDAIVRLL